MTTASLSQLVHYYKQCYQASFFQADQGHGIFENKDIQVLGVYPSVDAGVLSENGYTPKVIQEHVGRWLVDQDDMYLVEFTGVVVSPSTNASGSTSVHYSPAQFKKDYLLQLKEIQKQQEVDLQVNDRDLKEQSGTRVIWEERKRFLDEVNLNLASIIDSAPPLETMFPSSGVNDRKYYIHNRNIISPESIPSVDELNGWLIKQAKQVTTDTLIEMSIVALVPRNFRSIEFKQDFVQTLDALADENRYLPSNVLHNLLQRTKPKDSRSLIQSDVLPFLSAQQQKAIINALRYDVSFIQGPPGTGKSYTVAALVATLIGLNKSVLIATHSDHALTVVKEKLVIDFDINDQLIVHFGHGRRNGTFARQIKKLSRQSNHSIKNIDEILASLSESQKNIDNIETGIERELARLPSVPSSLLCDEGSFIERLKLAIWRFKYKLPFGFSGQIDSLKESVRVHKRLLGMLATKTLQTYFNKHYLENAEQWGTLSSAISQKTIHDAVNDIKSEAKSGFQPQSGLKLWLATLDDVPEVTAGMFDFLIIDEATQVNMATVLPALSQAYQVVVVGDPKQLRHVSFLSRDQEKRIADSLNIEQDDVVSFRNTSFLDYIDDYLVRTGQRDATIMLDEHYRSIPLLMQFNSDQFYDGEVQVLTGLKNEGQKERLHLSWQRVPNGKRIDKVNNAEAGALIVYLKKIIEDHRIDGREISIGVISFFRDQAEFLTQEILQKISIADIKKHQIKIGTPFSFQGEERDHILISCGVDDNAHHGSWTYLNKPDVFNVATSRARHQQTMFISVAPEKMPAQSLLKQYYSFSLPQPESSQENKTEPWLTKMVNALEQAGYTVSQHQLIADIDIDLVISYQGQRLAIDLIGFPSDLGAAVHLNRYLALHRVGIPLLPMTAVDWLCSQDECLQQIQNWAQNRPSRLLKSAPRVEQVEALADDVTEMNLVLAEFWEKINSFNTAPELAKSWGFDIDDQLEKLQQMDELLSALFEPGTLTYMRYQSAVNTIVEKYIDNLSTYQLLYNQVWENSANDAAYWDKLIAPIKDRYTQISQALNMLHQNLQLKVAQGSKDDEFALKDLENLANRLQDY